MITKPFWVPVLMGVLATASAFGADADKFKILFVEGPCQIQEQGKGFQNAQKDASYANGSVGKTGPGSKTQMKIEFAPQNTFRLFPDSEVVISPNVSNPRLQKIVNLRKGKIDVNVSLESFPEGYQMKVQTPTAVCGAMGTAFTVEEKSDPSDKEDKFTFKCTQHSITVVPRNYEDEEKPEDDTEYNGFLAKVPEGAFIDTSVRPGKENAIAQIKTGELTREEMPEKPQEEPVIFFVLGSAPKPNEAKQLAQNNDPKKLVAPKGTEIQIAQGTEERKEIALEVKKGSLQSQKGKVTAGKYVVNADDIASNKEMKETFIDFSKGDAEKKFDSYVSAVNVESSRKKAVVLAQAAGEDVKAKLAALDQAAKDATEKRKALFHFRDEIRRAVRGGLNATGGVGRPTQVPRIPR